METFFEITKVFFTAEAQRNAEGRRDFRALARVCPGSVGAVDYFGSAAPDLLVPVRYAESIKII
jgi:hypothetical protein